MNKLVSIIMPLYNAEKFIAESIDSVLSQTYQNWELIIVDDCSIDDSANIVKKYQELDERIKYYKLENNSGAAIARNKAIEIAQGEFIAFLDSDDLWAKEKLEIQISFMEEKNVAFSITDYQLINTKGEKLNKYVISKTQDYNSLLKGNRIGCLTVIIDRKIVKNLEFKKIGHEDYALWLEILKKYNIRAYNIPQILAYYRKSEGSLSSNKFKAIKWMWYIFRNEQNKGLISSFYLMYRYAINVLIKKKKI